MRRRIQYLKGQDVNLGVSSGDVDLTMWRIVIDVVDLEFVPSTLLVENNQRLTPSVYCQYLIC